MVTERLLPPLQDCTALRPMLPRVFLAALVASIGVKAGLVDIQLFEAGSRFLEGGAVFGTPLLVVPQILFVRRLWLGMLGAALVTLAVYAFCHPYLEWIHRT